jgi:Protein of unknown function (DUF3176)
MSNFSSTTLLAAEMDPGSPVMTPPGNTRPIDLGEINVSSSQDMNQLQLNDSGQRPNEEETGLSREEAALSIGGVNLTSSQGSNQPESSGNFQRSNDEDTGHSVEGNTSPGIGNVRDLNTALQGTDAVTSVMSISPEQAAAAISHHQPEGAAAEGQATSGGPSNSNSHQSPKSSQHTQSLHALFEGWRWEMFTWCLGSMGFMLIIILLGAFKNKPNTMWKSKVHITAMVAALSQVAQSALIVSISSCISQAKWIWLREDRRAIDLQRFDDASRGPEGSIRLLWHLIPWFSTCSRQRKLSRPRLRRS